MKRVTVLLLAGALLLSGCTWFQALDRTGMLRPGYRQISQEEAARMMERDDGHVVVDVRQREEYYEAHIPGAVLIPNESIGEEPPELLPDKDQIILIYCRSGNRSKQAARKLADMGYTQVYEFGGIRDWTGPVITEDREAAVRQTVSLVLEVGDRRFYASPEDNESAEAFIRKLNSGSIAVEMQDAGGVEKLGLLPWELPRCDGEISIRPGDLILCEGDRISLAYDEDTRSCTRLARFGSVNRDELLEILGEGDVTVSFWLEWSE